MNDALRVAGPSMSTPNESHIDFKRLADIQRKIVKKPLTNLWHDREIKIINRDIEDNLDETLFANQNQIVITCLPITNQAPFRYSFGDCLAPVLEHQEMALETSCEKSPCGTNPTTKLTYIEQGSWDEGSTSQRLSGDALS
ncbi:hypothetical protein OS493_022113 [Desmophyllum pertusum]|uniref:Uncharacterized protein n=1 Tax=Desmophyllum pertusum TaxID=174260 RepID=A0A9X0CJD0_9CNID|nr:hypothetical protein OS493_022113 [Desmophyllum pertusum]